MLCLLQTVGFFTSFIVPKLYSCYSSQIHKRGVIHLPLVTHYLFSLAILLSIRLNTLCSVTSVEILRDQALEAWKSCPRKKLVAAMVVTMCWNMFSVKTRVMAGVSECYQPMQFPWNISFIIYMLLGDTIFNCAIIELYHAKY